VAPHAVVFASMLQFLLAATFLVIPAVGYLRGARAQRAAEAEVVRQGFPAKVLAQHRVSFEESGVEILLPVVIALCLATLASLNLTGSEVGRILSWIFQSIVLVGGGIVMAGQVFTVRFLKSAFKKSGDATLQSIDVKAFVDAALGEFPVWFRYLVAARFVLATVGSLLVIILLAVPSANAYFR
jgi:hypothetical protein